MEPKEFSKEWFDDTSKEWRSNKRKMKGGIYRYTCEHTYTHGKKCGRDVFLKYAYCRQHWAKYYNISTEQKSSLSQTTSKLPTYS
jgi:hypothetical protein